MVLAVVLVTLSAHTAMDNSAVSRVRDLALWFDFTILKCTSVSEPGGFIDEQ